MTALAYHVISKEVENLVFITFLGTCMYNQPMLTKTWNYNNFVPRLHSYLRCCERLLDVFFLLLAIILSECHENPRRKDWLQQKVHKRICVRGIIIFWLHALLLISFFVAFSVYSLHFVWFDFTYKNLCSKKSPSPLPPVSTTHAIMDFFSKCDQIHSKLRIWSHLLMKSLMENFIFCAV